MKAIAKEPLEKHLFKIFITYEILIFIVYVVSKNVLVFAGLALLPTLFAFLSYSRPKIYLLYFLIFYTCFFPEANWGSRYEFFLIHVSPPLMFGLIGAVFLFMYLEFLERPYQLIRSKMDFLVLALLIWLIFSALWGLSKDHSMRYLRLELLYVSLYGIYFIFRDIFRDIKHFRYFLIFFLTITLITSVQYIFLFFSEATTVSAIFKRVVTQQTHIILIGYMVFLNIAVFDDRRWLRITAFASLFPHILAIFFSQQRGLWGAAFIGTIIFIILNGIRSFSKKTWIYVWIGTAIILTVVIVLLIYVEDFVGGSLIFTTLSRLQFLFAYKADVSLQSRMAEILVVLKEWVAEPILGTGLGSSVNRFAIKGNTNVVDNSFINYLWKMGIVGFTIYAGIIIDFFSKGFHAIKGSKILREKNLITAVLVSFFSMMIVALTNSSLFIYRFNMIWAMIFAVVHRFYDKNIGSKHEDLYRG